MNSKKLKNTKRNILIMGGIFIAALIIFFINSVHTMQNATNVQEEIEESSYPIIRIERNNNVFNAMQAYTRDMGMEAERDMITPLPEDLKLKLNILELDNMIVSIQYEIRTLSLDNLIENGKISSIERQDGIATASIPIQNLIEQNQEYLLKLIVDTGEHQLFYYTRILWTEQEYLDAMITTAKSFTEASFDKSQSKAIIPYLETSDSSDNSSYEKVNLKSSFDQITWGNTGMEPDGTYAFTIKDLNGIMGSIRIQYYTKCNTEAGENKHFFNEDNYVLRYDPTRIYIMNYERTTTELLNDQTTNISDGNISLGVVKSERTDIKQSDNGLYTAYTTGKALFEYDGKVKNHEICIYKNEENDTLRQTIGENNLRILSVKDDGSVYFCIAGHIQKGKYEGSEGITFYTFDKNQDTVTENFFIPLNESFEKISYELDKLLYLSNKGMVYFYHHGNVIGIDMTSYETVTLISGLQDDAFTSSHDKRYIAFDVPDSDEQGYSRRITFIDLEDNSSTDIQESNSCVHVYGFIGTDLVYGVTDPSIATIKTDILEPWTEAIHIIGRDMKEKTVYENENELYTDVRVEEDRVKFEKYAKNNGVLQKLGNDTIISNTQLKNSQVAFTTKNDSLLKKIKLIEIDVNKNKPVQFHAVSNFSLEKSTTIELSDTDKNNSELIFQCYVLGHFKGYTKSFAKAVQLVNDDFGIILDDKQEIIYNRADKKQSVRLRDQEKLTSALLEAAKETENLKLYEATKIINAAETPIQVVLYYLQFGYPIVVSEQSQISYITAYDNFNIKLVNADNGEEKLMGLKDAESYFDALDNPFIVFMD